MRYRLYLFNLQEFTLYPALNKIGKSSPSIFVEIKKLPSVQFGKKKGELLSTDYFTVL
jgi:hypothetical protein